MTTPPFPQPPYIRGPQICPPAGARFEGVRTRLTRVNRRGGLIGMTESSKLKASAHKERECANQTRRTATELWKSGVEQSTWRMTSSAPEDRRDIENEVAAFLPGVLLDLAVDEIARRGQTANRRGGREACPSAVPTGANQKPQGPQRAYPIADCRSRTRCGMRLRRRSRTCVLAHGSDRRGVRCATNKEASGGRRRRQTTHRVSKRL